MFFLGLTRIEKKARRWEKMGVPRGGEAISKVKREKKKYIPKRTPIRPIHTFISTFFPFPNHRPGNLCLLVKSGGRESKRKPGDLGAVFRAGLGGRWGRKPAPAGSGMLRELILAVALPCVSLPGLSPRAEQRHREERFCPASVRPHPPRAFTPEPTPLSETL
jgi:hypothetical protein